MATYYLSHAGIKGMKWGVRRFQNKDGTLTEAGKRRYDRDVRDLSATKKKSYEADVDKWVSDDLNAGKRLAEEGSNLSNKLKGITDTSIKRQAKTRADLSTMTDQEMRNRINRELLEKQYNDLFTPQNTSKGKAFASKTLEVAGNVLTVGSTALGIALAIKELRK